MAGIKPPRSAKRPEFGAFAGNPRRIRRLVLARRRDCGDRPGSPEIYTNRMTRRALTVCCNRCAMASANASRSGCDMDHIGLVPQLLALRI